MGRELALACCLLLGCSLDREPIFTGQVPVVSGVDSAGMAPDANGRDSQSPAGTGDSAVGNSPSGTAGTSGAGSAGMDESGGTTDSGATGSGGMPPDAGPADAGTQVDATPGSDAGPPVDFYGMCSDDSQCLDQAVCLRSDAATSGSSWGGWRDRSGFSGMPVMSVCSPPCATAVDCPRPLDARVAVTCYVGSCILDCTAGAGCPTGATCVDADLFGPAPALCLWPLP